MATLDVITLSEAKAGLNIVTPLSAAADAELAIVVSAVSQRIDDLCGAVVRRVVNDEPHDGGVPALFLREAPAARTSTTTITSVTEDGILLAADEWLFKQRLGILYRRSGGVTTSFAAGDDNIVVDYDAGRYATTAAVTEKFKQAAIVAVNHIWTHVGSQARTRVTVDAEGAVAFGIPPWAMPKAALELLANELQGPAIG